MKRSVPDKRNAPSFVLRRKLPISDYVFEAIPEDREAKISNVSITKKEQKFDFSSIQIQRFVVR